MACSTLLYALLALACGSAAQPAPSTAETQSPGVGQPSLVTVRKDWTAGSYLRAEAAVALKAHLCRCLSR